MFVLAADALTPNEAVAMMSAMMGTVILVALVFMVLFVWMFWRIFVKAGMNGALGLLCLIPSIGLLVCLAILAFSTWPGEVRSTSVTPAQL